MLNPGLKRLLIIAAGVAMVILGFVFLLAFGGTNVDYLAWADVAGGIGLIAVGL